MERRQDSFWSICTNKNGYYWGYCELTVYYINYSSALPTAQLLLHPAWPVPPQAQQSSAINVQAQSYTGNDYQWYHRWIDHRLITGYKQKTKRSLVVTKTSLTSPSPSLVPIPYHFDANTGIYTETGPRTDFFYLKPILTNQEQKSQTVTTIHHWPGSSENELHSPHNKSSLFTVELVGNGSNPVYQLPRKTSQR